MAGESNVKGAAELSGDSQESSAEKATTAWMIPAITAAVLALGFCVYYFVYVGARREYLANRNFRALALLGEQFQQSISVHGDILDFCAELLAGKKQAAHVEKLEPGSFLIVHPEDERLPEADRQREALKDYLKYLAPSFEMSAVRHDQSAADSLRVERRNDRWELVLRSFQHGGIGNDYQGSLNIRDLMEPLVASQPFDDILLVSQKGFIVYQSKAAGPQFTTLTSLLQAQTGGAADKQDGKSAVEPRKPEASSPGPAVVNQNEDPTWRSRSMHLTDLMLAGTRYKLFLQPILVSPFKPETRTEPASEWVLCGLRSSSALDWEALSLSYTFFIWFTAVFFVIWTSYKVLKIFFMNHREHLRLRELGALGLSLVLLAGVITLSLLELDNQVSDDTEATLQRVGQSLSKSIHRELGLMRDQLTDWCGSKEILGPQGDLNTVARNKKEIIRNSEPEGKPLHGKAINATARPHQYPFLSNAFWTDDDGHQIVKWSATQYVTPMMDVSELAIFARPTMHLDNDATAFRFVSILPPNKVEYLATFGMKTSDCAPALAKRGSDSGIGADIADGYAFLSAQPLSLIDPVLPYGYGFALVDEAGTVLFHSDKTRNGSENFLTESDGNKQLYAAVFGHTSPRSLSIKYMGKDHRALVLPVEGVSQAPWSLIVFRDLTAVRTLNLQVMTLASTLLCLALAGPVIVIAVWCAILRPRFAPEWLWPNRGRVRTYAYQIYSYALLALLFLVVAARGSTEAILIACAAVPNAALLLTLWCFRMGRPAAAKPKIREGKSAPSASAGQSGRWKALGPLAAAIPPSRKHSARDDDATEDSSSERAWIGYRTSYMASVLLLLLLLGILTPMALFRASLDVERRLGIKQAQLRLASALSQRWMSIVNQHEKGEIGDAAWSALQSEEEPWRWIVPDNLSAAGDPLTVAPHTDGAQEHFRGWLLHLLYWFHHDYNEPSAEMLGVIPDSGNPADWSWDNRESTIALRWYGAHPPMKEGLVSGDPPRAQDDLLITSAVPGFSWRNGLKYAIMAGLALLATGGLLWALARKLFLFQVAPLRITGTRQAAKALRDGRSVLVLLPPVSDWRLDAPTKTVDVSQVKSAAMWDEVAHDVSITPANSLIELSHFEFVADDAEAANRKFAVLDLLLKRDKTQVAVVMTVPASSEDYRRKFPGLEVIDLRAEPFLWLRQYEGPARDLIWNECGPMAALWPLGAQLANDLKAEPVHTEDTIASEILERADPYYRMIWNECSNDQKFVLSQLAADGLANPRNGRAIRQLLRRGLISKDPQFRIMNESFRRFLRSATTTQMKQAWLHESRHSGWGKMHGAFFTTMTLLGVFLLATQNALWQSAAAYVTTALAGLGTLTKVSDMLRGRRKRADCLDIVRPPYGSVPSIFRPAYA